MSERWKPEFDEYYWIVNETAIVQNFVWTDDKLDRKFHETGNCFKTEAEARAAAEKVKALLLSLHDNGTLIANSETLKGTFTEYLKKCAELQADMLLQKARERRLSEQYGNASGETQQPDWCKVGGYGYDYASGYFKIVEIVDGGTDLKVEWIKEGVSGTVFGCNLKHKKQARLRPYNAEEMRGLVGKVIEKGPSMHIVTGFENVFDNECMVHVNGCLYGANDLLRQFTIDNAPCGVLEHLENGEWVE